MRWMMCFTPTCPPFIVDVDAPASVMNKPELIMVLLVQIQGMMKSVIPNRLMTYNPQEFKLPQIKSTYMLRT
jgi:hypothetical protein